MVMVKDSILPGTQKAKILPGIIVRGVPGFSIVLIRTIPGKFVKNDSHLGYRYEAGFAEYILIPFN